MDAIVDVLRAAVAKHDDWPDAATKACVIDAARNLVHAIDMRAVVIAEYRQTMTPTAEAIQQILGGA